MLAALAVNAAFSARGEAAEYFPPESGLGTPCRVVVDRTPEPASDDDGRPRAGQVSIDVRKSELSAPANKGTFKLTATGERFAVQSKPKAQDGAALVWTMRAIPAPA